MSVRPARPGPAEPSIAPTPTNSLSLFLAAPQHPGKPHHKSRLCTSTKPAEIRPATSGPCPIASHLAADACEGAAPAAEPAGGACLVNGCVGLDLEGLNAYLELVGRAGQLDAPALPRLPLAQRPRLATGRAAAVNAAMPLPP